jgi:hypothetical protein
MSLLRHESEEEIDDTALGEEYTKGSSHMVWAVVIAAVLISIAIAVFVFAGEKPPIASGEIVQVWAHPSHVVTSGFDANGEAMAKESFDQVLIFAHIKLRNQSQNQLNLDDILANAKLGDGTLSVSAGSASQFQEVFLVYPELAALHTSVLPPHTILAPGQTLDGTAFWAVRLSKSEWDARQELNFTFRFQYQPSLVLAPHSAIIEK